MTQTLLDLTQEILENINGDEVNSIGDTEESEAVSRIIRSTYRAMVSNTNWPHTRRATALISRADSNFPTHMVLKEDVKELISIRYNKAPAGDTRRQYSLLTFKDPDDFLTAINRRNNDDGHIDVVIDDSGIELLIRNDQHPKYYTSFDDVGVVFDAYDASVDSVLQESKLQAQGYIIPSFSLLDSFVPDLPVDAFSMLLQEATSVAQFRLRQFQDIKAEQESLKQQRWLSRKSWRTNGGIRYPDYGRK